MKRREFLASTALVSLSTALNSKEVEKQDSKVWLVLDEVYLILFPKTKKMPSSKEFGVIAYLQEVMFHPSFKKDDKEFILQGAKDFLDSFPDFLTSKTKQKEQYVKDASESSYGNSWLDSLVYYGIEAMLSDPIYSGNTKQIGWQSLNHQTGLPQPKVKYARHVR